MDQLVEYRIPYLGLKVGRHIYDFRLSAAFFESFGHGEVQDGDVHVSLELDRQVNMMVLDFELNGWVLLPCDRCGEDAKIPIKGTERLIVKMSEVSGTTDDDILELGPQEHLIDVSSYLYEYVHLMLPAKRLHVSPESCNEETLERLRQIETKEDETPIDPRWEGLKGLSTN
jgi:uncharacterized metal-binding protein YceD (DUF177 family)